MSLRRGFKAEAERLAEQLRTQAGAKDDSSLDLDQVAALLKARIVPGDSVLSRARFLELKALQDDAFSACTFSFPGEAVIVFNPLNVLGRRNSDIAHELSHLALDHRLRRTERIGSFSFF